MKLATVFVYLWKGPGYTATTLFFIVFGKQEIHARHLYGQHIKCVHACVDFTILRVTASCNLNRLPQEQEGKVVGVGAKRKRVWEMPAVPPAALNVSGCAGA